MRLDDGHRRRARLQSECEVNTGPALLLAAAAVLALVLVLFAGAASAQPTRPADAGESFDNAMQAYERNHWQAAYAGFAALADAGDPEAARIATQMWRHGPALYRTSFEAKAQQLERWSRLWGCGTEPTGRACLQALRAR